MLRNAVGEPFILPWKLGIEKNWMRGWGGECQEVPSRVSGLELLKNFVGQTFSVSITSGIEKVYASEGYVSIFCQNFLSHSAEKSCR